MSAQPQISGPASTDVVFTDLWSALRKGRLILLACVLAGAAAAIAIVIVQKPVYRVEILLASNISNSQDTAIAGLTSQIGGIAGLLGGFTGSGSGIEESLALLRSKALLEQFIRDNDLMPVLYADLWNPESRSWKPRDPEDVPTLNDAVDFFDEHVRRVRMDSKTGLVTLAIEWTDPGEAVRWAEDLVARVNRVARERAITEASRSVSFLNEELQKTAISEVRQAIYRVLESRINSIMLANVRDQFAFKILEPARVPDPDQYVRPKAAVLLTGGIFLGFVIGCFALLMQAQFRAARRHTQ